MESLFREPAHDVQVVDFGMAKLIDPSKPVRMGTVIGTWLYMSPEQWTGAGDIDYACAFVDGASPHEVKEWLGHAQISLTLNTYAHVLQESKRGAANRLAKLLA